MQHSAVINLRLMAEATVKIMQNICYWNVASLYILSYSSFFMAMAEVSSCIQFKLINLNQETFALANKCFKIHNQIHY